MSFLSPWILLGLFGLPVLWWLLRVTPPLPKRVIFPPLRFLQDLVPEQQTASHTPWWLLLLRVMIVALVLIGLARPVQNISDGLPGGGVVRLVIDNDWAAAQNWDRQMDAAAEAITQAEREGRSVQIYTTAVKVDGTADIMSAAQARAYLKSLEPMPWAADYEGLGDVLKAETESGKITLWFGTGLASGGFRSFATDLKAQGDIHYYMPPVEALPVAIYRAPAGLTLRGGLRTADVVPDGTPYTVQAVNDKGGVLVQFPLRVGNTPESLEIDLELPDALRGEVAALRLSGVKGAGGVHLLDDTAQIKTVGILGPSGDVAPKPFIEARYYLSRALEDSHRVVYGSVDDIMDKSPAVILIPDMGTIDLQTLTTLEDWVKDGGTVVRFAGAEMLGSRTAQALVPVPLRLSGRSLEGALTWDTPKKLQEFRGGFADITPADVTVNTQILAQPSPNLEDKSWAVLEDGTPLITVDQRGRGLLVFVHTTASAAWSDLALSGLYVEILQRIVRLSGRVKALKMQDSAAALQPVWVLDGWGRRVEPSDAVRPLPAGDITINAEHPPGLYGANGVERVLNLGEQLERLRTARATLPSGIDVRVYSETVEKNFMPIFLTLALMLFLVDWVLMLVLHGALKRLRFGFGLLALMICIQAPSSVLANDIDYADGLYLAYIKTGNMATDTLSQRGLEAVASALNARTSTETKGVVGVDPARDPLVFFPVIYWPVIGGGKAVSPEAMGQIQSYLDHGGTILIDTQNKRISNGLLTDRLAGLRIPVMQPIESGHVLKKSFYLLDDFPGRYRGGEFWVEQDSGNGRDGVSSVLTGANDWASAWTDSRQNRTRKNELSLRFGVNVVMYALTGNYKADQVHLPHILERLGQ